MGYFETRDYIRLAGEEFLLNFLDKLMVNSAFETELIKLLHSATYPLDEAGDEYTIIAYPKWKEQLVVSYGKICVKNHTDFESSQNLTHGDTIYNGKVKYRNYLSNTTVILAETVFEQNEQWILDNDAKVKTKEFEDVHESLDKAHLTGQVKEFARTFKVLERGNFTALEFKNDDFHLVVDDKGNFAVIPAYLNPVVGRQYSMKGLTEAYLTNKLLKGTPNKLPIGYEQKVWEEVWGQRVAPLPLRAAEYFYQAIDKLYDLEKMPLKAQTDKPITKEKQSELEIGRAKLGKQLPDHTTIEEIDDFKYFYECGMIQFGKLEIGDHIDYLVKSNEFEELDIFSIPKASKEEFEKWFTFCETGDRAIEGKRLLTQYREKILEDSKFEKEILNAFDRVILPLEETNDNFLVIVPNINGNALVYQHNELKITKSMSDFKEGVQHIDGTITEEYFLDKSIPLGEKLLYRNENYSNQFDEIKERLYGRTFPLPFVEITSETYAGIPFVQSSEQEIFLVIHNGNFAYTSECPTKLAPSSLLERALNTLKIDLRIEAEDATVRIEDLDPNRITWDEADDSYPFEPCIVLGAIPCTFATHNGLIAGTDYLIKTENGIEVLRIANESKEFNENVKLRVSSKAATEFLNKFQEDQAIDKIFEDKVLTALKKCVIPEELDQSLPYFVITGFENTVLCYQDDSIKVATLTEEKVNKLSLLNSNYSLFSVWSDNNRDQSLTMEAVDIAGDILAKVITSEKIFDIDYHLKYATAQIDILDPTLVPGETVFESYQHEDFIILGWKINKSNEQRSYDYSYDYLIKTEDRILVLTVPHALQTAIANSKYLKLSSNLPSAVNFLGKWQDNAAANELFEQEILAAMERVRPDAEGTFHLEEAFGDCFLLTSDGVDHLCYQNGKIKFRKHDEQLETLSEDSLEGIWTDGRKQPLKDAILNRSDDILLNMVLLSSEFVQAGYRVAGASAMRMIGAQIVDRIATSKGNARNLAAWFQTPLGKGMLALGIGTALGERAAGLGEELRIAGWAEMGNSLFIELIETIESELEVDETVELTKKL